MEENCFSLNTEECYILLGDYINLTYDEIICLFIYLYFVCLCKMVIFKIHTFFNEGAKHLQVVFTHPCSLAGHSSAAREQQQQQ